MMKLGITGHRDIQDTQRVEALVHERFLAHDPRLVIIGCAKGFDTLVGWVCVALNIPFYMYLPFEGSYYDKELVKYAQLMITICDGGYSNEKYFIRDRKIVDDTHSMLAYYDGRNIGGTYYTLRYANKVHRDVDNIYAYL